MNTRSLLLGAALAAALTAGCGGGSDKGPSVSNMSATPVMWGKNTSVTVTGDGLLAGITASMEPACPTMTKSGAGSDSTQTFTCKILKLGDQRVRVRTADGAELAALRLDVPTPQVTMRATQGSLAGNVVIELDPVAAPKTVENFLNYVNAGTGNSCFYASSVFHRVVREPFAIVQGGGYTSSLSPKAGVGSPIVLESNNGLKNLKGTIAMARTDAPNSATSQFYFNVTDNPAFDYVSDAQPGYAVFGHLVSGQEVIDYINSVPTTTKTVEANGQQVSFPDTPTEGVLISACSQTR